MLGVACGVTSPAPGPARPSGQDENPAVLALDLARTRPLGPGVVFRPRANGNAAVAAGSAVGALRCLSGRPALYGAHVELFAADRGMQVPAGIGVVARRRCHYPLSTRDPTGVVRVERAALARPPTVGDLFALWGQPLSRHRLASFSGSVVAFVDGRRWAGDPRRILLRRHAQIVLEVGPLVQPHPSYLFPPGL